MILDSKLLFGKNIAVTGSAAAVKSFTNTLQMDNVLNYLKAAALNDIGKAGDLMLNIRVTSTQIAATSTATTLAFKLHKKASASSIKSGSVVYTVTVPVLKAASISNVQKLGAYIVRAKLPKNTIGDTTKTFIGLTGVVGAQAITTGKVTAWLGLADDTAI